MEALKVYFAREDRLVSNEGPANERGIFMAIDFGAGDRRSGDRRAGDHPHRKCGGAGADYE